MRIKTRMTLTGVSLGVTLGLLAVQAGKTKQGEAAKDRFGSSIAVAGDTNGDGTPDVVIGAPGHEVVPPYVSGKVYLFSGQGGLLRTWTGVNESGLGGTVAPAGDFDGDSHCDVIASALLLDPDGDNEMGIVKVFSGRTGETLAIFSEPLPGYPSSASIKVASAGDVNGDGKGDVILGFPYWPSVNDPRGFVSVHSGETGQLLWRIEGESGMRLGGSLSRVRDLDGDGLDDVLLGAPGAGGHVYARSGADGRVLCVFSREETDELFGESVAAVGDVDKDGTEDIAVGATLAGGFGNERGRVYLFSGRTQEVIRQWEGESRFDFFGLSVSMAGDVNGDRYPDILVSAIRQSSGNRGKAYLYSGRTGTLLWSMIGENANDYLIWTAGGSDLDGDGFADFLLGAPLRDGEAGTDSGKVYFLLGERDPVSYGGIRR